MKANLQQDDDDDDDDAGDSDILPPFSPSTPPPTEIPPLLPTFTGIYHGSIPTSSSSFSLFLHHAL